MDSQVTQQPPTHPKAPASHAPEGGEPEFVVWVHLGAESVFFYPPGSAQEHLVIEHGIPSVDMHWKVKGYYSHEGTSNSVSNPTVGPGGWRDDTLALDRTQSRPIGFEDAGR
jgi:hypothetical protein